MEKYEYKDGKFIINDFLHAKKFSSFLPGVAGVNGKPIWAFYANAGQCIGGFGIDSKETPIAPFDSAYLAYQNIPFRGFNTVLEINDKVYRLFKTENKSKTSLEIERDSIKITEETDSFIFVATYSSLSCKEIGALLRHVTIQNKLNQDIKIKMIDGLAVMLPFGLSNYCFQALSTLMSSYCCVDLNKNAPYLTFKGGDDCSEIKKISKGNAYFGINKEGKYLKSIVDPNNVYVDGITSNITFNNINKKQVLEGQIPCGMLYDAFTLKSKAEYSFVSLYGSFNSIEEFNKFKKNRSYQNLVDEFANTKNIVKSLIKVDTKTSSNLFDEFVKQSFFDNALRGGFPLMVGGKPAYVFSRKHGDMERDYNDFVIPSTYFSAGPGNYRDVNQNRRNDLYIEPRLFDSNIYEFFSLIGLDGYNPLTVKPRSYSLKLEDLKYFNDKFKKFNYAKFSLSELYTFIDTNNLDKNDFDKLVKLSTQNIEATTKEGYWIDHWTYNTDLLENFISVYPDKIDEILICKKYKYFASSIKVEPRTKKYCIRDGKVRQYNSVIETQDADGWVKDKSGNEFFVSLQNKILNLIVIKSLSLDPYQLGIEMEAGRPGWNDALNGLPGLFGSSMNETVELLRLTKLFRSILKYDVDVTLEQLDLFNSALKLFRTTNLSRLEFWDKSTLVREKYRDIVYGKASEGMAFVKYEAVNEYLTLLISRLEDSIRRAKEYEIVPTYFINEVSKWVLKNGVVIVEEFKNKPLNEFLEVYTHLGKLGKEYFSESDYKKIKDSDIFDKKLNLYKTCGSIENESFELGRIRSFSPGWLERECAFLHMSYKYLVSLFGADQYDLFFTESKKLLTFNINPEQYGRNPIEASSFIVPTCNKNKSLHGQGFFARLTGANSEVIDLLYKVFIGQRMFIFDKGELTLNITPRIPLELFKNNEVQLSIFGNKEISFKNPDNLKANEVRYVNYKVNNTIYEKLPSDLAKEFRSGQLNKIEVILK